MQSVKRKITVLALAALLALGAMFALAACNGSEPAPTGVKEITTTQQTSGNVRFTNYQAIISADTDWNNMSDADKQKIIDYTFTESRKEAADNDVTNYNIIGVREDSVVLFMWDKTNDQVFVYKDGQPAGNLPVPAE